MANKQSSAWSLSMILCQCGFLAGCTSRIDPHVQYQAEHEAALAIKSLLSRQAEAWNRGDIDGFMAGYWKSDSLTFSSGGRTERGWQATYDRYKAKYPTPERMGRLEFGELDVQLLDSPRAEDAVAYVLGRWFLQREPDPVGGNFTLILRKMAPEGWRIVHDHTSVDPNAKAP